MQPAVYIMANRRNGTIYTGVTLSLIQRAWMHWEGIQPGFTKKYRRKMLVWYELHCERRAAIGREKQIKDPSRKWKLTLIESMNPAWRDLFNGIASG